MIGEVAKVQRGDFVCLFFYPEIQGRVVNTIGPHPVDEEHHIHIGRAEVEWLDTKTRTTVRLDRIIKVPMS